MTNDRPHRASVLRSQARKLFVVFVAGHVGLMLARPGSSWLVALDVAFIVYMAAALLPKSALSEAARRHVIMVDGECVFCNRLVSLIVRVDERGLFHFAHVQGPFAQAALLRHGVNPTDIDGVYLLANEGTPDERLLIDGAAGREIWPRLFAILMPVRLLPTALLDIGYRLFARFRYDLFGKYESCHVPSEAERARFFA